MKYAIVIMDGGADEPLAVLGGQSPFEKAKIVNTDWISQHGRLGMVRTVPDGFAPGSDVALMSVLGYDPKAYYRGRAPLEAAAQEIALTEQDWIFRCNLVTIADGKMMDYSAGHIESVQAAKLIEDLNEQLGSEELEFYAGVSYRHLMVNRSGEEFSVETVPPHDIADEPVAKYLPRGKQGKKLVAIMERAAEILADHEVNKIRGELGENQATNIWLWGQGKRPQLDNFREKFGVQAAVITAVDLLRGLGKLTGMQLIEVEGATGYLDTNYGGKCEAAIAALAENDLVVVHVEAPDEAAHGALVAEKVQAIERIDTHIVGPLLKFLQSQKQWRMMVLPDHPTPIRTRAHSEKPVPFALAGSGIINPSGMDFNEDNGKASGLKIEHGCDLMEYFLRVQG
ncbi:MAG: cofactor-independent phosphoglycerate mutase [Sedimentisphaerales bacterium]|nr:cofactor-independent phosphoglycerate mutase [Sedimentisphaerales bacterium]